MHKAQAGNEFTKVKKNCGKWTDLIYEIKSFPSCLIWNKDIKDTTIHLSHKATQSSTIWFGTEDTAARSPEMPGPG